MQVLAAAGAVNHDELVKLASDAFGSIPDEDTSTSVRTLIQKVRDGMGWPRGGHLSHSARHSTSLDLCQVHSSRSHTLTLFFAFQEPALYTGSYVHDRFPDASECSFAVAFRGASWTDPDSIPLMVMQTMLGEAGGANEGGT